MRIDEKARNVHFQLERDSSKSYSTPFPYTHTLWKASDLVFDVFSHMSKKFKIIEYTKPTTFFIFLVTPRKNLVATAPNKNVLF